MQGRAARERRAMNGKPMLWWDGSVMLDAAAGNPAQASTWTMPMNLYP
jgi:hypothetical protein